MASRRTSTTPVDPAMPPALLDATRDPDVVRAPARKAVCIDGRGSPADAAFARSLGALYGVAYTLKFARKAAGKPDWRIGALEGRWTAAPDTAERPRPPPRSAWRWRLRLAVPADVTAREVHAAIHAAVERKGGKLEGSREARAVALERIAASRYGRVLHVGPYADEPESIARVHAVLAAARLRPERGHVEIYLSDPRRTPPRRLRTVLLVAVRGGATARRAPGAGRGAPPARRSSR